MTTSTFFGNRVIRGVLDHGEQVTPDLALGADGDWLIEWQGSWAIQPTLEDGLFVEVTVAERDADGEVRFARGRVTPYVLRCLAARTGRRAAMELGSLVYRDRDRVVSNEAA